MLHDTSNSRQNALRVFYLWDFGVTEKTDKGFGKTVKWDVDLLGGYDHEFVPNVSRRPGTDWFGGLDNPELLRRVKAFAPDAVLQFGYNYKSLVGFDLRWNTRRAPLLFRGDSHLLAEGEQSWQLSVFSRQQERFKRWMRELGLRLLFKRFACFLAVGKANADYFRAHGVPESKIVRCPHVVDNEFFRREPEETRGPRDQEGGGRGAIGMRHAASGEQQAGRGLREELGIPEDELVFLFAGKLEEKKQPMELLEAFLAADLPKATLLFVGSGQLEEALKEKASHGLTRIDADKVRAAAPTGLGESAQARGPRAFADSPPTEEASELESAIEQRALGSSQSSVVGSQTKKTEDCQLHAANSRGNVVFLEFQNQSRMPDVYRTGDVLVLPSKGRYETWGLAVNEAACCGLPAIVSSHVGCGPDLIDDGKTGWIFEAGNTEDLRRCLCEAASNRHQLGQMGSTLQRAVLRGFSYELATSTLSAAAADKSQRPCEDAAAPRW